MIDMTGSGQLTIVQLNDSHGYLDSHWEMFRSGRGDIFRRVGGFPRIAGAIERIREERCGGVLALDCGDTIHGTYPAVKSQGKVMVPILNEIGFDAMTAHWEFAYGPEKFDEIVRDLSYPALAINCYDEASGELRYPPYLVKETGGLKVGIIGIAATIVDKVMPPHFSEGIRFTLGNRELPGYIDHLKKGEKVDLILVLSHLGFPQEVKLASEVDGIDVLLSGHTHNRLENPVMVDDTIIIQSGCHGSFLGILDVRVGERGISDYDHQLLVLDDSLPESPLVREMTDRALAEDREMLSEAVGRTSTALHRYTCLESTMDNFLLEGILDVTGAEMAFSNGWRYGAPIPPGPVTLNDLYNILPVDPPVSMCRISGEELRTMMEENLERTFAADPYEQMGGYVKRTAGLDMYFKVENPAGERIQEMFAAGHKVDPGDFYEVAFVTEQGVPKAYGHRRRTLNISGIQAMREYLEKAGSDGIEAPLRGRIVAV
ncbi:MAG: bifunctional metallophosphatase/5'-nucleotidase [Clostridia bacterium]